MEFSLANLIHFCATRISDALSQNTASELECCAQECAPVSVFHLEE